jgi:hypothetical protein
LSNNTAFNANFQGIESCSRPPLRNMYQFAGWFGSSQAYHDSKQDRKFFSGELETKSTNFILPIL